MIELSDIVVKFRQNKQEITAVDRVSLNVEQGSIYGIVGYSGAGKSTLVRVINLLQRPNSGGVKVADTDLLALPARQLRQERRKIGMIFQHFNLMESRTVFGNVAYALEGSGLSKQDRAQRIEKLLDLVDILPKRDSYPSELSGGQKQRVAIARALASEPNILLCDEATSALDPKTTIAVLDLLKQINENLGITIVIITHEMQVVKEICDKVAVMEDGKIIEQGSVIDIFSDPKQPLTIDFIRTASHIEQARANIAKLAGDKDVYEIRFIGERASEPVIVDLYKRFGLTANVLYGDVEYLQGKPMGVMLVSFDDASRLEEASEYLNSLGCTIANIGDAS